jgi:hypothetical protein
MRGPSQAVQREELEEGRVCVSATVAAHRCRACGLSDCRFASAYQTRRLGIQHAQRSGVKAERASGSLTPRVQPSTENCRYGERMGGWLELRSSLAGRWAELFAWGTVARALARATREGRSEHELIIVLRDDATKQHAPHRRERVTAASRRGWLHQRMVSTVIRGSSGERSMLFLDRGLIFGLGRISSCSFLQP